MFACVDRAQCRVVFHLHARRARRPVVGLSEFYYARPQAVFVEDAGHQVAGCDVDEGRGCRGQFRAIAAAHSVESPLPTELIRKCVVTAGPELRIRIFAREARQARVFHVPVGNRVARGCRVFGGFGLLPADEKPEFIRLPGVDALGRDEAFYGDARIVGEACPFGCDRARKDAAFVLCALLRRLPVGGTLQTVLDFGGGVIFGRNHRGYDGRVVPEVDLADTDLHVGGLDMEHPPLRAAVAGDVDQTNRFEARGGKFLGSGRVGGDVGRPQLEAGDRDGLQVGAFGDIGRGRTRLRVDQCRSDLPGDGERPGYGLLGHDRPLVVLVERERDIERRPQVELPAQRLRSPDLADEFLFVGHHRVGCGDIEFRLVDGDLADIGLLVQRERHGTVHEADAGHREPLAFDAADAEFDGGIR